MARSADVILSIAVGGAIGSVARYLLGSAVQSRSGSLFPVGTLAVNLIGCVAVGFLMRLILDTGEFSPAVRALLTTGFCGGFTTFSTFAWEAGSAIEEGSFRRAIFYMGGSVVLGLACVWLGSAAAQVTLAVVRGDAA